MLPISNLRSSSISFGSALSRRTVFVPKIRVLSPLVARQVICQQPSLQKLLSRTYSVAARVADKSTDDFFVGHAEPRVSSVTKPASFSDIPQLDDPGHNPDEPLVDTVPFESLKGRINHDTLKALTFKPFQFKAMSEVQRRVLGLLPELAGGKLRGKARIDAESSENQEEHQEENQEDNQNEESKVREDLLVKAKTGTGKTIAFLVPAIDARMNKLEELSKNPGPDGVVPDKHARGRIYREVSRTHVGALIISPTRELANQIANEATKLCTWHKELDVHALVGGESRGAQLRNWKNRKDIIVATPGRLRDLLGEPKVKDAIAKTDMLILDEADTLLDMGFSDDLEFIIDHLPQDRQTLFFSATVSREIRDIARKSLRKGHQVIDCVPKNETNTHLHIPQYYTVLPSAADQIPHILRLIAHDQLVNPKSKIILFLNTTKHTMLAATLIRELSRQLPSHTTVYEIHSKLNQNQRTRASDRFRKESRPSILITSDVSARGVDYPGVTRVIQVGIPSSSAQYIHRVGRTGRAGKEGRGDLVLLPFEAGFVDHLSGIPIQPVQSRDIAAAVHELASTSNNDYTSRLNSIPEAVANLVPSLDASAVEEVFMSMLGYYVGKSDQIGLSSQKILDGLKDWAMKSGGLPEPPYLSPAFLQKVGLGEKRQRRSYGRSNDGDSRGGFGRNNRGESRGGFGRSNAGESRGGFGRSNAGESRGGFGRSNAGESRGGFERGGGRGSGFGSRRSSYP
ncbi:hypothetical protein L204_104156 [Cryptococcus depauperatus]|nr:RNA helicase [Cryptococcus depauperatus CBS 7855]